MKQLFTGDYTGQSEDDIKQDILDSYLPKKEYHEMLNNGKILYAELNGDGYEEDSYILLQHNGFLYENYASHCSCYGFEDQFEPEKVTLKFLYSGNHKIFSKNKKFLNQLVN